LVGHIKVYLLEIVKEKNITLSRGIDLIRNGNFTEAVQFFQKILESDPKNIDAMYWLARAYIEMEKYGPAKKCLEDIIKIKPDEAEALNVLGFISVLSGDNDMGLKYFKRAIEVNPSYQLAWYNLGLTYIRRDDPEKAVKYLEKAVELDQTDIDALNLLGISYGVLGEYDKAIKYLNMATKVDENVKEIWFNLGSAYAAIKDFQNAIKCYEKALEIDPKDPLTLYTLGRVYIKAGIVDEGKEYIKEACELGYETACEELNK